MQIGEEQWKALKVRGVEEGVTVTGQVGEAIAAYLGGAVVKARLDVSTVAPVPAVAEVVPAACSRCRHGVQRHGPRCDVMGCLCRAFQ